MLKVKRNITFLDRLRATFHWIRFIQFRFRRGRIASATRMTALQEEIIPAYAARLAKDFYKFRHQDHHALADLLTLTSDAKIAFLAQAFQLLARNDFKIHFLYAFKKSRNFFGDSKKAKELKAAIEEAEEESANLLKFMKSLTSRNRKMVVDLNLKLAVVQQTKRRETIRLDLDD
jgi:hypothetical protein